MVRGRGGGQGRWLTTASECCGLDPHLHFVEKGASVGAGMGLHEICFSLSSPVPLPTEGSCWGWGWGLLPALLPWGVTRRRGLTCPAVAPGGRVQTGSGSGSGAL